MDIKLGQISDSLYKNSNFYKGMYGMYEYVWYPRKNEQNLLRLASSTF